MAYLFPLREDRNLTVKRVTGLIPAEVFAGGVNAIRIQWRDPKNDRLTDIWEGNLKTLIEVFNHSRVRYVTLYGWEAEMRINLPKKA